MKIYKVGGAVRDELLNIPAKDNDWVVVGATEQDMLAAGYQKVDSVFPVFLHPESKEEYALARLESKTGPGYKGFEVDVSPQVTLEQDLIRRDLTINAIAQDLDGHLIDPFNGQDDLNAGLLRHVSPAFSEDPVRLLRIARFAAKLGRWGFHLAHETFRLMKSMAASDDLLSLKPERIWQETYRALAEEQPWMFFKTLHRCGAMTRLMPEMNLGESVAHGRDVLDPSLLVLQRISRLSELPEVRLSALILASVVSKSDIEAFCSRLRVNKACSDLVRVFRQHEAGLKRASQLSATDLYALLTGVKALQNSGQFLSICQLVEALWPEQGQASVTRMQSACQAMQRVNGKTLVDEGFQGVELGQEIERRRIQSIETEFESR